MPFSTNLNARIEITKKEMPSVQLGRLQFSSPLVMAPLAGITDIAFRRLMTHLGAGALFSELISCHGINYAGERTLNMLKIHQEEKMSGIQLFGEDGESLKRAATVAETYGPKWIDLNMGCPVRKVVTKGAGAGLLKNLDELPQLLKTLKEGTTLPLSIKIRTGWSEENLIADQIANIAKEAGVEFFSLHGRTQTQAYRGKANWSYIEEVAKNSPLPMIGNGDMLEREQIKKRLAITNCKALMIGRGALRNPFLFLEPFTDIHFTSEDYVEVVRTYYKFLCESFDREAFILIQLKKQTVWWTAGIPNAVAFRKKAFASKTTSELLGHAEDFFLHARMDLKRINPDEDFLTGGHG